MPQSPQHPIADTIPVHLDALLILGRGIMLDGRLSTSSRERAEVAAELVNTLQPPIIVFSGGRSWRQVLSGAHPPGEGQTMLDHAVSYRGPAPEGVNYLAEITSDSTVGNFINSQPLLKLQSGAQLGVLSDELHFSNDRISRIANLAYPGVQIHPLVIPRLSSDADRRHEKRIATTTRWIMAGVRPGDSKAVGRRQHLLETINAKLQRPLKDSNPYEHEVSYRDVPGYENVTPQMLAEMLLAI